MSSSNFPTSNASFRKLLGNGDLYRVPPFQRDYAWNTEQWEELWLDMMDVVEGKEEDHYLGYLVLHELDPRTYQIIDGQQRIVTLSLLVLGACKVLQGLVDAGVDSTNNQLRLNGLRRTFIGDVDPVTLTPQTKLTLNRNNNDVFADHLVELRPAPHRNVRRSSRLMGTAMEWLTARIRKRFHDGPAVAGFIDTITRQLFFTVIQVPDEVKAYRVFETLNARGVQLSSADLLKNRLFALVHEHSPGHLQKLATRWNALVDRVASHQIKDFLREHLLSRGLPVRKRDLYRRLQERVTTAEEAFALVRGLEDDLDAWLGLVEPSASTWPIVRRRRAELLRKTLRIRQPIPLLLAAHRQDGILFDKVLDIVLVISIRYNAIGRLPPQEQEDVYARTAKAVDTGEISSRSQVIESLSPILPSDDAFRVAFANKTFRLSSQNKKTIRYILSALESDHREPRDSDTDLTIEHVLPRSPGAGWDHVSDAVHAEMVDRLGNLALLEASLNRDLGNNDWTSKRAVLANSSLHSTRRTASHECWDAQSIADRQDTMAKRAVAIWRLDP